VVGVVGLVPERTRLHAGKLARLFELAEIQVSEIGRGFVLSEWTCDAKTGVD
jgi:hypothetical protein